MGAEVEELMRALARLGCPEVDEVIPKLVDAFAAPGDHDAEVREVLLALRSHRCFAALDELAKELAPRAAGPLGIFIRRQLAQANVDRGRLDEAIDVLTALSAEIQANGKTKDRSEVAGLLGRVHKQRFVRGDQDRAAELRAAIASHQSVFELDPSWHGANVIALSARAEREGISLGSGTAKSWAEGLLRELNERARAAWSPWDFAAAGEAYLALDDAGRSVECFRRFWSSPNVDAFALGGAARQLREIWQVDLRPDSVFYSILMELETRTLGRPGGHIEWSSGDLHQLTARAEALFGVGTSLKLGKLLELIGRARSICRISDPRNSNAGGTGFLVEGTLFGVPEAGSLLLTNHHVLHEPEAADNLLARPEYLGAVPVTRARAEFTYWEGSLSKRTFAIKEIRHHSDRDDADFSLATLDGDVPPDRALPICTEKKPLRSRNITDTKQRSKVLVVGHPRGEELAFSLDNTEVVDHELDDGMCAGPRRIHYRTTTDRGSSGSPVFEFETLEVVGLHRSGRANPLRPDWPRKRPEDVYEANEAVWIGSVTAECTK